MEQAHRSYDTRSHCDIFSQGGKLDSETPSSTALYQISFISADYFAMRDVAPEPADASLTTIFGALLFPETCLVS